MTAFILSIVYFVCFGIVIYRTRWFRDEHISRHWLFSLFGIKLISSIVLTAIYTHYYTDRSMADMYKYFDDSAILFDALKEKPIDYIQMLLGLDFNHAYFEQNYYNNMLHWERPFSNDLVSDSHVIIRLNAFFRLFSFGEIMVHNVFMNFLSFSGLYMLYRFFKRFSAGKEQLLMIIMVIIPSVLFWGSGLLKEGILIFGIALIVVSFYSLIRGITLKSFVILLLGLILVVFTKFYLLVVLFIPLAGLLFNIFHKRSPLIGFLTATLLFVLIVNVLPTLHPELDIVNQISMKQQSFSAFIKEVPANSGFEIAHLTDGYSIVRNLPNALLNTVVRPFLWECNSPFVLLSFLENVLVIFCLLIVLRFRSKITRAQQEIIAFNISFVLALYLLVGLTTPVFGAIVRYKIPGLLFLFVTFVILLDKNRVNPILKWLKKTK